MSAAAGVTNAQQAGVSANKSRHAARLVVAVIERPALGGDPIEIETAVHVLLPELPVAVAAHLCDYLGGLHQAYLHIDGQQAPHSGRFSFPTPLFKPFKL
jgi:hypothetical protein